MYQISRKSVQWETVHADVRRDRRTEKQPLFAIFRTLLKTEGEIRIRILKETSTTLISLCYLFDR